jgi:hypothetical protein
LEEERRKRQELERQLAEIRKGTEPKDKKTFWDDPEGHFQTFEQKLAARETALVVRTSEAIARSKYKDFDEVIPIFGQMLQTTPGLHAQWLASPDPAEFAYRAAKHTNEIRQAGSLDSLRVKIAKEERAKLEAEFKTKQEELEKQRKELPGSLSDVKGAAKSQPMAWKGPTPFEEILKP